MNAKLNKIQSMHRKTPVEKGDFFPTEPRFVDALLTHEEFGRGGGKVIWEPACGEGDISQRLNKFGYKVISSDLFDRGYGRTGVDFLKAKKAQSKYLITNPPFALFDDFFEQAWKLTTKFAFISGVPNLASSKGRADRIWFPRKPKKIIVVIDKMDVRGSGKSIFNHCWLVWDKKWSGDTSFFWHMFPKGLK